MSGRDYSYLQSQGVPQGTAQESEQAIVRRIAKPILDSLGLVLVEVEVRGRGPKTLVRVFIERPPQRPPQGGTGEDTVTVADCERAHVLIGHALDVEDPIPHAYVLEVSSPGLDRPIRGVGDYTRFQGRLARFKLARQLRGQSVLVGRIRKVEDAQVWIETGSSKDRGGEMEIALPLAQISEARLEVEF